jgi:hypothetical protein
LDILVIFSRLGQEFIPWDGKPMCKKCYKELPKKTRKANKSKLIAERKMDEKERERYEKEQRELAKGQKKEVNREEEWKKKALENLKEKKKAKAEEYKERQKK